MADVNDLLAQAVTPPTPAITPESFNLTDQKKASVAVNSTAKKAAMGGSELNPYQLAVSQQTGKGAENLNELDTDLRSLSSFGLIEKYGADEAARLMAQKAEGSRALRADQAVPARDPINFAADTLGAGVVGFGTTLAGLGSLGLGLVNDTAGAESAQAISNFTDFFDTTQSEKLQAAKRPLEAKNFLTERDNRIRQEEAIAEGTSPIIAGLENIGRNVIGSVDNATDDFTTLSDGVANALGSLFAIPALSRGAGAVSELAVPLSTRKGVAVAAEMEAALGSKGAATVLNQLGKLTPGRVAASIGAVEAGGSYQQIVSDIAGRSHETLMAESPMYQELIAQGMPQEEARNAVANRTGLLAAAITAPAAVATGGLVSRFEGAPLAARSAQQALRNSGRETVEEGLQGGISQLSQNLSEQQFANENQDFAEGVGRQIGEGALYGLGMSAALNGPGLAGDAATATAQFAGRKAMEAVRKRVDSINASNEAASPVATNTVLRAAQEAQANAAIDEPILRDAVEAADADDAQKADLNDYITNLMNASAFDPGEVDAALSGSVAGATNRADAIHKLASVIAGSTDDATTVRAGRALYDLLSSYGAIINGDQGQRVSNLVPEDSEAGKILGEYNGLVQAITQTPAVLSALEAVHEAFAKSQEDTTPVTEESLATPEGIERVNTAIDVAQYAPEVGNLETNKQILYQAEQGKLQLTPKQKAALDSSVAILEAVKAADLESQRLGNPDPVSLNIRSVDGEKGKSVLQHTQGIMSAWNAGDMDSASVRLTSLGQFVQGLSNKVAALNTHFASGNPQGKGVTYSTFKDGVEVPSARGVFVQPTNQRSVDLAHSIARDAKMVGDVYNRLVTAFPNLKGKHIPVTPLDSQLDKPSSEVVAAYKKKPAVVTGAADTTETTITQTSAPTATVEPTPEAVEVPDEVSQSVEDLTDVSDAELNDRINEILDIRPSRRTPEQAATLVTLDAEMSKREDDAAIRAEEEADAASLDQRDKADRTAALEATEVVQEETAPTTPIVEATPFDPASMTDEALAARLEELELLPPARFNEEAQTELDGVTAEIAKRAETVEEAEPVGKGTEAVFPNLFSGNFAASFSLPKKQGTHTLGSGSPLALVQEILANGPAFVAAVGSVAGTYTQEIAKAYKDYLGAAPGMVNGIKASLAQYLETKYSKAKPVTYAEILAGQTVTASTGTVIDGKYLASTARGRLLNIAREVDGTYELDQELVEGAVLAGLQWMLEANNYGALIDDEVDAAKVAGVPVEAITPDILERLKQGMSVVEAKSSLANKITNYWGLRNSADGFIGMQKGITEALAAEILTSFVQSGLLVEDKVEISYVENDEATKKDTIRLVPQSLPEDSPIHSMPSAIEHAVLVEPIDVNYVGSSAKVPVAQTQMRNPLVSNTEQQLEAIENEQSTEYFLHLPMVALYNAFGKEGLIRHFGSGGINVANANVNHAQTLEGRNREIVASYDRLNQMVQEVQNVSEAEGTNLDSTPTKFAFNMSKVSRMQMLGRFNPQASKLVREAMMPTQSTLDLTDENGKDARAFTLGMAQALGVKVHKKTYQAIQKDLAERIEKMMPSIEDMGNFLLGADLQDPLNQKYGITEAVSQRLEQSFKAIGEKSSYVGVLALVEYSRFLKAKEEGTEGSFNTPLYLEADGITNGPINAMVILTAGGFTAKWVDMVAKGGLFFNMPGMTANQQYSERNADDLYQETTNELKSRLSELKQSLIGEGAVLGQHFNQFETLMDFLLPDVSLDASGNLIITRGATKNPLTITVYGSGGAGIAAKLTSAMTDALYEIMTTANEALIANPDLTMGQAMFGTDLSVEAAQAKLTKFGAALNSLIQTEMVLTRKGHKLFPKRTGRKGNLDLKTFTLNPTEINNLRSSVKIMFVGPMSGAIYETLGSGLFASTDVIQKSTQLQSIMMSHYFKGEVEKAIAARKEADPQYVESDFLTNAELDGIYKAMLEKFPNVKTPTQEYFIAGASSTEVNAKPFGSAANGKFATPGFVYGPANAGVSGIPYINIGTGDGQMMQSIAANEDYVKGTLKVFDGMNMPLDKIDEGSVQANQAVFDSWMGNPMQALNTSYEAFLEQADFGNMTKEAIAEVVKAIDPFGELGISSVDDIHTYAINLGNRFGHISKQIEARHAAIAAVDVSVDQMAAAASPYQNEGTVELVGDDSLSIENQLNKLYSDKMKEIAEAQPSAQISQGVKEVGDAHPTGVTVIKSGQLATLASKLNLPKNQQAVMDEIVHSLAADGFTIVMGDQEQVANYNTEMGKEDHSANGIDGAVKGYTNIGESTIYLLNPSSETLVHELIHAATFTGVLDVYNGKGSRQVGMAVRSIEEMMMEFLDTDFGNLGLTQSAYQNAVNAISGNWNKGTPDGKAAAVNEFMAWTLSNYALQRLAKQTKVSKAIPLGRRLIDAIRGMFGIRTKVGTDVFSNLLFNSAVVMHRQPNKSTRQAAAVLFQNNIFGNNERVAQVGKVFAETVGRYLNTPIQDGVAAPSNVVSGAIINAENIAQATVNSGFSMTPQEVDTFKSIVVALATEAQIDPNALAGAAKLYAHFAKTVEVEDFMVNREGNDPNDRAQAVKKYEALLGQGLVSVDFKGRSSLMPTFLALATVNDEFRSVLNKMSLPKGTKKGDGTFDTMLENAGVGAMDSLSARMSGIAKAPNVKEAIDSLNDRISDLVQQRETTIDQMASKAGGVIDRSNDYVVNGLSKLSNALIENGRAVANSSSNKYKKGLADLGAVVGGIINEQAGEVVSRDIISWANKKGMWEPLHTLINDIVGRTSSNANIYDMIKTVRSMVAQTRQQFREHLPELIQSKFTRVLTEAEWTSLHTSMGKTDLAVLRSSFSDAAIFGMLTDSTKLQAAIASSEATLTQLDSATFAEVQTKAKQLAKFMLTGVPGVNLLRNATAVANLFGSAKPAGAVAKTDSYIAKLDQLITMYALEQLSQTDKTVLLDMARNQKAGMSFTLSYLVGQRADEMRKAQTGVAKNNHYKGYIPSEGNTGVSLIVADDREFSKLARKSYKRVGKYTGNGIEIASPKSYYLSPAQARSTFEQGIMQNVRQSAAGVDSVTGYSMAPTAGRITDPEMVKKLASVHKRSRKATETLLPIFDENGEIVAFERSLDPAMTKLSANDSNLSKMIGVWRGRQVEEESSQIYNRTLIDNLKAMYDKDMAARPDKQREYVNLSDTASLDPVLRDAVNLFNPDTLAHIEKVFGQDFYVRKDMLNDALGYRAASIGDAWTGTSRWSPETQKKVADIAISVFGNDAYKTMVNAEKTVQQIVADARVLIVVKSVVVPVANLMSNVFQLIARGVPISSIGSAMPKKLAEVNEYTKSRIREIEAEAELRAATDPRVVTRLKVELKAITDSHRRMSIWPLIEAGEFSAISDANLTRSEVLLTSGRLQPYIEQKLSLLPKPLETLGKYAMITKDTALFQGLQKTVEYGDFLAKAILFDDLTKRQKKTPKQALARVTEEFVNYDRLPGRFRGSMENIGMLWFYNFKIRSTKVALSMIRNNPVHALLATVAPAPEFFGSVGLPTEDNMFSKLADGTLDYSIGPGQGLNSIMLNPWLNVTQ
jgi:hypothetical protein